MSETWIDVHLQSHSHFTVRIGYHRPRTGAAPDRVDMTVTLTETELRRLGRECDKAIAELDEYRSGQ